MSDVWPRTITLKHPIEFGSQTITTLEVRRGRVGDLKGVKLSDVVAADDLVKIAARITGQTTAVIELLDADDAGEVMGIALNFYARLLSTGSARSG